MNATVDNRAGDSGAVAIAAATPLPVRRKGRRRGLQRIWGYPAIVVGGAMVGLVVIATILAPWLAPRDPLEQTLRFRLSAPGQNGFLLGSDDFGRDVLSRLIWGARISLAVGIGSVGLGALVGVILGLVAGFYGRLPDAIITRLLDVLLTFPTILLAITMIALMGAGLVNVIAAIAVTNVPRFARVTRGSVLSARERDFVAAARCLGADDARILIRHLLPEVISPIIVLATLNVGVAILTEASLSFLGLGVAPPTPTWGSIIQSGSQYLERAPWVALSAGTAITLTVLAFNLFGDGTRDALYPRLRDR